MSIKINSNNMLNDNKDIIYHKCFSSLINCQKVNLKRSFVKTFSLLITVLILINADLHME